MAMHAARLDHSPRLQRVADLLADGREYSTREISRQADVYAVNSIVAELRANGYDVQCKCLGRGLFVYWIPQQKVAA